MNPQDKAKELVEKFKEFASDSGIQIGDKNFCAKECALIAVDEIIMFDINAKCESQFVIERKIEEYWLEVKQEIEKIK